MDIKLDVNEKTEHPMNKEQRDKKTSQLKFMLRIIERLRAPELGSSPRLDATANIAPFFVFIPLVPLPFSYFECWAASVIASLCVLLAIIAVCIYTAKIPDSYIEHLFNAFMKYDPVDVESYEKTKKNIESSGKEISISEVEDWIEAEMKSILIYMHGAK
jgi:hypothetical protein